MEKKVFENIIQFMQRVDLKGGEAPAFMEAIHALKTEFEKEAEKEPEKEES